MKRYFSSLHRLGDGHHRKRLFSLVITVLVMTACILTALVFDTLEARFALQKDFSFNGATTHSRIASQQLQALTKPVHVYVVSSTPAKDNTLLSLLTRYAAETDLFTFSEESVTQSPTLLTSFRDALNEREVTGDCLIVHCSKTGRTRIILSEDFIVYEYDTTTGYYVPTGINYDKVLTEAIVFTAQEDPLTVQLLRGHGEISGDDLSVISQTLTKANYNLEEINLLTGDTLDVDEPLLILCPQLDLSEKELALLMQFANAGGHFFIISDYTDPIYENYSALLRTWGIDFYTGLVMAQKDDRQSYYDEGPAFLMPRMTETDMTRPLIESGRDTLLLPGSRAIYLPETAPEGVYMETQLITGRAYVRDYVNSEPNQTIQQPTDAEGYFALSVLSSRVSEEGNVSRMLVTGNAEMFTNWWINENTYASDYLLRSIQYLQGESPLNLDIAGKTAVREPLTLHSLMPLILTVALLPIMVLAVALRVLLPRKHL